MISAGNVLGIATFGVLDSLVVLDAAELLLARMCRRRRGRAAQTARVAALRARWKELR